jgi:hypothetical protein
MRWLWLDLLLALVALVALGAVAFSTFRTARQLLRVMGTASERFDKASAGLGQRS